MNIKHYVYIFLVLLIVSCSGEVPAHMRPKPSSFGTLNQVVVISDKEIWDGMVGDSIDYYLAGAYPILPSFQPSFDLRFFTGEELMAKSIRREMRTYYIVANLQKEESVITKMVRKDIGEEKYKQALAGKIKSSVGKNKWANGQLVMYVFGNSDDEICVNVRKTIGSVTDRVHIHDRKLLKSKTFSRGEQKGISKVIQNKFDIDLEIPYEYREVPLKDNEEGFVWLRKDTKVAILSIVLKKEKYTDINQMSKVHMKELRDKFGEKFVTSSTDGSYAQINDIDMPIFEYNRDRDDMIIREYRGIWEMTDDFTGGPFASFFILNKSKTEVLWVDTFVMATGKKKRDMMQTLGYIVSKLKWE